MKQYIPYYIFQCTETLSRLLSPTETASQEEA